MEVCTFFAVSCTWKVFVVSGSHSTDGTEILRQPVWICSLLPDFSAMPAPTPLHLIQAQRFMKLSGTILRRIERIKHTHTRVCGGEGGVGGWQFCCEQLRYLTVHMVHLEFCRFVQCIGNLEQILLVCSLHTDIAHVCLFVVYSTQLSVSEDCTICRGRGLSEDG